MAGQLQEYIERLTALPPTARTQAIKQARAGTSGFLWVPNPGPQTAAYFSEADETLYGGEAGGGKSDLIIGLSLSAHQRSLVLRRTNKEAEKLFDRYSEIIGNDIGKNAQRGWRIAGRIIDIGGCQLEADKQKRKGIPHDLKGFDELVDFSESQYRFICAWTRSNDQRQRCRIVATTNPPTSPEGMWVVKRWSAWLDPTHPNPAQDGELRWYVASGKDEIEVDGPGPHEVDGKMVLAKSRTFIRSRLEDNPDLVQTDDYRATLAGLPIELREAYAEGRFDAQLKDQAFQAIPTDWIRSAMERWGERPPEGVPMCAVGVDASGGGDDPMIVAPRYDAWFEQLHVTEGREIPKDRTGKYCAGIILSYRRDKAIVVVDMGGGYGGSIYEHLVDNGVECRAHKGSEESRTRTQDGQLGFYNKRSEVIWRFREALDPAQPGGSPIQLPPDQILLADLAAPRFETARVGGRQVIKIESKEDVVARLKRSTDRGDAVVQSWSAGPTYVTDGEVWRAAAAERGPGHRHRVIMGRPNKRGG